MIEESRELLFEGLTLILQLSSVLFFTNLIIGFSIKKLYHLIKG